MCPGRQRGGGREAGRATVARARRTDAGARALAHDRPAEEQSARATMLGDSRVRGERYRGV